MAHDRLDFVFFCGIWFYPFTWNSVYNGGSLCCFEVFLEVIYFNNRFLSQTNNSSWNIRSFIKWISECLNTIGLTISSFEFLLHVFYNLLN